MYTWLVFIPVTDIKLKRCEQMVISDGALYTRCRGLKEYSTTLIFISIKLYFIKL